MSQICCVLDFPGELVPILECIGKCTNRRGCRQRCRHGFTASCQLGFRSALRFSTTMRVANCTKLASESSSQCTSFRESTSLFSNLLSGLLFGAEPLLRIQEAKEEPSHVLLSDLIILEPFSQMVAKRPQNHSLIGGISI